MTAPVTRLAAILWLVTAVPAGAQQRGTVEVGGFARFTDFDNSLALDNTAGMGDRVAVYLRPRLALEVAVSRTSAEVLPSRTSTNVLTGGGTATHMPVRARVVYDQPWGARIDILLGAGYVRNIYGGAYDWSDGGLSALVGVRYPLTGRVGLRMDADADFIVHTENDNQNPSERFLNATWGLQLGASVRLNTQ